ncbi:MAG TPA: LPS assembly lipoprotein LptE [Azospirillum sp.]
MSRRSVLTAAGATALLAFLPGCGFQPLYGERSAGAGVGDKLARIGIANMPDRHGQQLRNLLIDRFYPDHRPDSTTHRLDASITAFEQKLALRKDASAERAQLVLNVPYRLIENASGKVVFQASSRALIAYNVLEEHYAALQTVDNAYERGLIQISDEITNRVAMYLARGS